MPLVGDCLQCVKEPTNKVDKNAVAVVRTNFNCQDPVDTRSGSEVVLQFFLRRDVVPPYHDVVSTLLKRGRLKDIQAMLLCC